jgi:DNA (cytosine-5)-methyltransferase 1
LGFSVLVIWQCELDHMDKVKTRILRFVEQASSRFPSVTELTSGTFEEYRYTGDFVSRSIRFPNGRVVTSRLRKRGNRGSPRSDYDFAYLRQPIRPAMPHQGSEVRVADIFSGCGGLSLGAMEACRALGKRFTSVLALDNDERCISVYKSNFRCKFAYTNNITQILDGKVGSEPTLNERQFLKRARNITILLAGPPCQGNSDLNNRTRRHDPRNALYERVARCAELVRPHHVLIENVPSVVHGKEKAVQRSIAALRRLGYFVDSGIVDLAAIGVPQTRKRHVVVASMSKKLSTTEIAKQSRLAYAHSVRWAIGDLQQERPNDILTRPTRHTTQNVSRITLLHEKGLYDLPNRFRPGCHRNGGHSYKSMYGRLTFDEPAQTITSGFTSPGQGRFIHPTQSRTLTPHEAARLQLFPDYFDFSEVQSRTSLASMIGNAVPMKLSYAFCVALLS